MNQLHIVKPKTKQKIADISREIIRKNNGEIFSRELVFQLYKNGFKKTGINPTSLTRILQNYASDIEKEKRRVCNGLRQTEVVVYKLKE